MPSLFEVKGSRLVVDIGGIGVVSLGVDYIFRLKKKEWFVKMYNGTT